MSFDARDMVEVNRQLIEQAARGAGGDEDFVVVSIASWGRGVNPEILTALEPRREGLGFNGSVVARVSAKEAAEMFGYQKTAGPEDSFPVLGVAFKKTHLEWFPLRS